MLNDVTICVGPAGCGKTITACYAALKQLKTSDKIEKIVLVKSVTPLKDEEIGFLKGDLKSKMEPFVYSFVNNFQKLIDVQSVQILMETNVIEILPIAYMRGINLDNSVVIIDEVQNITHDNIKTILTRLGENSKMILLGDTGQIDLKVKTQSCLSRLT
jgi:phosphate starvation-inducible PhoH-like protein